MNKKRGIIILISILLLTIIVLIPIIYFTFYSQNLIKLSVSKSENLSEPDQIIKYIGNFMELPDEAPTVATVKDVEKLRDQPLFRNALNGDMVIIYNQAGKAIIFRTSTKKIVEVLPVQTTIKAPENEIDPKAEEKPSITPTN